jgi:hypothetical protein
VREKLLGLVAVTVAMALAAIAGVAVDVMAGFLSVTHAESKQALALISVKANNLDD